MPLDLRFKSKEPLDGLETVCCWCYVIDGTLSAGDRVGIYLDPKTPVYRPDTFETTDEQERCGTSVVQQAYIDPGDRLRYVVSRPVEEEDGEVPEQIEICFAATCEERPKRHSIGTVRWKEDDGAWRVQPGTHTFLGPATLARGTTDWSPDVVASIARYEGLKSAYAAARPPDPAAERRGDREDETFGLGGVGGAIVDELEARSGHCPGGRLLVRRATWECRDGIWTQVVHEEYACPDGSIQTVEVEAYDTGKSCSPPDSS